MKSYLRHKHNSRVIQHYLKRRSPALAEKIVFLTGGAFTARARRFLDEVPNGRLEKPFEVAHLESVVNARLT